MEKELTCIICPKGCRINVQIKQDKTGDKDNKDGNGFEQAGVTGVPREKVSYQITGHSCTRGYEYAVSECTNPLRTLTTTVRLFCDNDAMKTALLPVKSARPLPKGLLMKCMEVLKTVTVKAPVSIGDVILRDILGTGTDIVATANITGEECIWRKDISSRSTRERRVQGQLSSTVSEER